MRFVVPAICILVSSFVAAVRDFTQPYSQGISHPADLSNLYRIPLLFQSGATLQQPVDYDDSFTRAPEAPAISPVVVQVSCGASNPLCLVRACGIIDSHRRIKDGFHIGEVIIRIPAAAGAAAFKRPVTVVICIRPASESRALFFKPNDAEAAKHFVCTLLSVSTNAAEIEVVCDKSGNNCSMQACIQLALLKLSLELFQLVLHEFYAYVELDTDAETVTAVSQPVYLTASRNVSVLVWGDHGGTMKTSIEMLLLAGVVPERLFCFQHQDWYSYVMSSAPCTRPSFPSQMAHFLKSMVVKDPSMEGFGGLAYSSIGNNSISEFTDKWSKEFDEFDVRFTLHSIVAYMHHTFFEIANKLLILAPPSTPSLSLPSHTQTLTITQVIWIEMSNVHALLFEGFAKHKLVMRSSHRWDHSTPYPRALPSMAWIRPALRQLVQTTAHISVATEWDYWYSRSVQIMYRCANIYD